MYKRIMVAVDESFMTDKVLATAVELARLRESVSSVGFCFSSPKSSLARSRRCLGRSHGSLAESARSVASFQRGRPSVA